MPPVNVLIRVARTCFEDGSIVTILNIYQQITVVRSYHSLIDTSCSGTDDSLMTACMPPHSRQSRFPVLILGSFTFLVLLARYESKCNHVPVF